MTLAQVLLVLAFVAFLVTGLAVGWGDALLWGVIALGALGFVAMGEHGAREG